MWHIVCVQDCSIVFAVFRDDPGRSGKREERTKRKDDLCLCVRQQIEPVATHVPAGKVRLEDRKHPYSPIASI